MLPHHHWEKIVKEFAREDAELPSTDISMYFRSRYAMWLYFRSSDDRKLHGSGRRVENASEGITLQLEKNRTAGRRYQLLPSHGRTTEH